MHATLPADDVRRRIPGAALKAFANTLEKIPDGVPVAPLFFAAERSSAACAKADEGASCRDRPTVSGWGS